MLHTYRITTQLVNPDGSLGELVDIVEMESLRVPSSAPSSYELWKDYLLGKFAKTNF